MMFKLFKELMCKQSMSKVKDNAIGVGLSCSKIILESLGGTINLIKSQPGETQFAICIPVDIKFKVPSELSVSNLQNMISKKISN